MRLAHSSRRVVLGLALTLVATPAFGQMIHGRLFEDVTLRPIQGATVQLLDARGIALDRLITTNATGTFAIRVEPGRYTLMIRRIGYKPLVTATITLKTDQIFEATYRVSPIAVRLATQRITAKPNIEWGRDGFMRRKELGQGGLFLTRTDFAESDQSYFYTMLIKVPGLQVTGDGSIRSLEGWRCLKYMVNGIPVKSIPRSVPGENTFPTLEDLLPTGHDVMGVEVYREFKEVPPEYRTIAWTDDGTGPRSTGIVGVTDGARHTTAGQASTSCGLLAVWTRAAW